MLKRVFSLFLCLVLLISAVPVQVFADGSDGGNIIVGGACVHNGLQHVGAAAPGCIDAGMTEHWHCPDCGSYWLDQDLLETTTKDALPIAALGHKWGNWEVIKAASCTVSGSEQRTCSGCGQTESRDIPATGVHVFGNWEVSKAATCTEKGQEVRACACGETETREIAALGHKWGQWVTTKEPTCTQEGVSTRTCETCKATETQPIAATGKHVFGNWEVSKAASCTEKGQEVRTCACGETETRELPATGHSWGDWAVTKAATCTAEGQEARTCGSCGQQETRKIAKIGHVDADKNGRCEVCGGNVGVSIDPVGSEFHPDQLIPGKETVHDLLPYNSGYWYHWFAAENGTIIVSAKGESLVMEVVNLSREDAQHVIDQVAGLGSVSITHTLEVKAGDEVTVWVGTRNENAPNDPPAATVTFKATFEKEKVCPHSWSDWTTTKAATCTAAGEAERKCGLCGISETKVLPATGVHVFGDWQVTKAATCTAAGEEVRKCGSCDAAETRAIAALGHKWGQWVTTKEPTCTEVGVSTRTCETCKVTETQPISATGVHTFGAWEVTKAATCTEKGQEVRKCGCGETETREIAAIGHKWGEWVTTKEPTCTVDGVESRTCANCGETETKAIPATGEHVFGNWEVSKAATCTEKGQEVRKCGCGETETKAIPATGEHVFGNWEVSKAATCTEKGEEARKCGCGETETREIAAIGHSWGEWAVTKAPTCTVDGVESRTCANCGETETKTIPATGEHVFGNWEVTKAATCTEKGQEVRKCGCGETETREIPAIGHSWGDWTVTKAPTCTVDGVESRTCANCGETETKAIPATGEHVFGNWEVSKAATCTEKGEEARKCGCGETETRELPAIGHSYVSQAVAATCTEGGYTSHTCANCSDTYTDSHTEPLGHTPGEPVLEKQADREPTCDKGVPAWEVVYCTVCGEMMYREEVMIPPLGHFEDKVVTAPTCTEEGYTTATCRECGNVRVYGKVPAIGHSWGDWEVTKAASCVEDGVESRTCANCKETETREIPATGHSWGEWKTTKKPGCNIQGAESRTCANCMETETRPLAALGHDAAHVEALQPTCQTQGVLEHWHCSRCDGYWLDQALTEQAQELAIPVDPDAHRYGSWTEHSGTGCTNPGYMDRSCTLCGNVEIRNYPASEHVDENKDGLCDKCGNALADECDHGNVIHVEAKTADCVAAGRIEHWLCQDCQSAWLDEGRTQKAESVTLPALGHTAQHTEAVAATCTQDGNLEYWHCQACDCYWLDEALTKVTNAEGLVIAALGHKDENSDGLCDNCGADLSLGTEGNPVVIVPGEEITYEFAEEAPAVYYQWTADQDGIFSLALTGEAAAAVSSNGLKPNAADPADKQAELLGGESIRWEVKAGETVTVSLAGAGAVALNPGFTAQSHGEGTMCNPLVVQGSDAEAAQVKISVAPGTTLYLDVANVRFTWLDAFAREGVRFLLDGVEQTTEDGIVSLTIGKGACYVAIENTSERTYNTQLSFEYMEGHVNNPVTLRLGSQELHLGSQDTLGRWFTWTVSENGKFIFHIEGLTGHDLWQYQIWDQTHNAEEVPPVDTLTLEVTQGQTLTIHVIGYGYAPDKVLGLPGDFRMETSFEDNIPDVPVDPNVIASGSCGENAAWVLDIGGTLTVSGKGAVETAPWQEHKDQILSIVLEEGITGIGDNAFDHCGNLSAVTLPGSLKTIGKDAFNGCAALESLKIPEAVETIGENAFAGCAKLSLVVTPDSPAETYAAEYGIPYNYPPAAQSIAVLWKGEDVTDQTVTVDMHDTDTLKLTADLLPQGAEGQVSWKVSDSKLALVENGTVQLKKPGTVTVTAALSGTKLTAAVKLEVLYLDAAKKLTALAEYPAEGLQQGYTARMQVWGEEALDPRTLEFSSSDEAMATVEEDGTITAGSKAGTVTITAAIKGDPLKRKVSLKVKIIAKQTHVLRLVPLTQEPAEVTMLDENGNVTEYFDRCAHFVVSIDRAVVEKDTWSFQILPSATGQEGEDVPLTEKSMKWTTSDSRIATVKADKSGLGVVTVKAKTNGACTIQAMSNDLRKTTAYITIHVRSYEPRLASTNLSMNIQSVAPVSLGLTESYGNAVKEATLHDYDSKAKTYLEEPSSRFELVKADGELSIGRLGYQKKGTYKLLLKVLCENGETYEYKLSLKVTDTLPTVTAKQLDKFNLFYKESTTRFQLSAKGGALRDAEWIGNDGFRSEFDPETGILTLYYSEAAKEAEAKVSNKGTIRFVFGDYFGSVEKAVTVKTEKKAPKLTMDPAVSVVNTALNGEAYAKVSVWPFFDESMSVEAEAPFAEIMGNANMVRLTLKENKGGTAYLYVKSDLWMESVKLVHKVKVEDKLPTVQSLPRIVLNQFFTEQDVRIAVELSQSNAEIASMTLESTATSEAVLAEAAKIRYEIIGTDVLVFALDENDLPKKGSYEFRLNVTLEDGTQLAPKTFKVTVEDKVPTVKLKSANLKLNRNLGVFAFAETTVILPKGYEEYALVDMVAAEESNDFRVSFEAESGILRADLLNASAASATLQLHPVVKHIPTGQEVTLEKTVALKLTVNAAKPGISLSTKGSLDTIVPGSAIVYTIRKLNNIAGIPEAVRLEGKDAELFNVQLTDDGSQVILTLKDGSAAEKGKTHKLELVFTLSGQEVAARVSVKVDQTNLKLAAVKPLNLYHANSRLACVLEVTAPQGARIGDITLNEKSAKQFLQALGADQPLTFTQLQDGRVLLSFKVANPGYLTWGKSYTVYLDITPEGSAANAKPTTVKLTVKTFK